MQIEIRDGDRSVFAMYDDGNVLILDNPETLDRASTVCREAFDYLRNWSDRRRQFLAKKS